MEAKVEQAANEIKRLEGCINLHATGHAHCHHVAVARFWGASFEGGRSAGGVRGRLL